MNNTAKQNTSSSHSENQTIASPPERLPKQQVPQSPEKLPPRRQWRWILLFLLTLTLVGGGGFYWNWRLKEAVKTESAQRLIPVKEKDLAIRVEASGTIQPASLVNISPKSTGRLAALYVDQGDKVKAGELLAKMNASDLEAELVQAQAQLLEAEAVYEEVVNGSRREEISRARAGVESAQASVDLSTSQLRRYRILAKEGAVSSNEIDRYVSEDRRARASLEEARQQLQELRKGSRPEKVRQAKAQVAAAQAQIKLIQTQLDETVIRAPFDGVVTQKYATVGAIVTPTTSASSTASATSSSIVALASGLEVVVYVPEADISQVKQGQQVEIVAVSYPDRIFAGRVKRIAPEAILEDRVTSFQVKVELVNGHSELRSGMNVDVAFIGKKISKALVVPTVAISDRNGQIGVTLVDEQGRPRFQPIKAGVTQDGQTQVLEGLTARDKILLGSSGRRPSGSGDGGTQRLMRRTLMR